MNFTVVCGLIKKELQLKLKGKCGVLGKVLIFNIISQLTFTCSKSATETLEKGVKYVQS